MNVTRWASTVLLVGGIAMIGCVDERACTRCIDEQVALRTELIREGLEPEGSLESREYYRRACAQRIIDLSRPCAPRYWPLALAGGALAAAGGLLLWFYGYRLRA